MSHKTLHAVHGRAKEIVADENPGQNMDPRHWHRAMQDLQKLILDLDRIGQTQPGPREVTPGNPHTIEDNTITIAEETMLEQVYDVLPDGWDVSVLVDTMMDDSYGVHAAVCCGNHSDVRLTIFVQDGYIRRFDFKFASSEPIDNDDYTEFQSETPGHIGSNHLVEIINILGEASFHGYMHAISTAVRALDYRMIRGRRDIRQTNPHPPWKYDTSQVDWSHIRGVTAQTISNNIADGMDDIEAYITTEYNPFAEQRPALEHVEEKENADLSLV